jgi:hypothetical protein
MPPKQSVYLAECDFSIASACGGQQETAFPNCHDTDKLMFQKLTIVCAQLISWEIPPPHAYRRAIGLFSEPIYLDRTSSVFIQSSTTGFSFIRETEISQNGDENRLS